VRGQRSGPLLGSLKPWLEETLMKLCDQLLNFARFADRSGY
jgi:hypothetical protein